MLAVSLMVVLQMHPPPTDSEAWAKPQVQAALATAMQAVRKCHSQWRDPEEDVPAFIKALDGLLDAVGETEAKKIAEREGHCFSAKLVAMALHRRKHPELYDAVGQAYGDYNRRDGRPAQEFERAEKTRLGVFGLKKLAVAAEHTDPKYRLVWEYRLLILGRLEGELCDLATKSRPTTDTLPVVADGRTLTTVVALYKFSYSGAFPPNDGGHPGDVASRTDLRFLTLEASPEALRAVLEWAETTERVWKEKITDQGYKDEFKYNPQRLLTELAQGEANEWAALAKKLPEDGLTKRERELRAVMIAAGTKADPAELKSEKK